MNDMGRNEEMQRNAEDLRQKANEVQEKVTQSINVAMKSAADSLDATANKMHDASNFFRDKNVDSLKEDFSGLVKKYPSQTVAGAVIFGFLFGKMLSR